MVFRPLQQNPPFEWAAGSIRQIFTHEWKIKNAGWISDTFLLISPYEHMDLGSVMQEKPILWPFSRSQDFSFVPGHLYYRRFLPSVLLNLNQALGHFALARTDYADTSSVEIFQAIPLVKMGLFSL